MTRMKDSGIEWIGEVPEEWGITKLKYICRMQSGNNLTSLEISSENDGGKIFPVYGGNGQRGYYSDFTNEGNYCLVGRQGALAGNVHFVSGKFWATDHAIVVYEHTHTYSKYLCYLLKAMNLNQYAFETSAQPGLSVEKILQLEMIHCPKGEQTQIADFLDKKVAQLDEVKSLLEEQIKTLEDYRRSLIYETVTKGLDKTVPLKDSGVDWIGQIPEGWGVKPIKYCSRFQRGFGFPVELQGNDDGEIPFYKVSDLRGNSDEISISKNYVDLQTAKQNAWVIVPSGAIIAPVIGAALLNNNRKISTVPFISDNNTLAIIPNNKNKYFYYLFKVIDMNWFNNSSTIPAVNISKLANQIVPTPKEEEQKQIADFLEVQIIKIDKLIEIKQKQINNINQQRQTLIYDVVTGKRRV